MHNVLERYSINVICENTHTFSSKWFLVKEQHGGLVSPWAKKRTVRPLCPPDLRGLGLNPER